MAPTYRISVAVTHYDSRFMTTTATTFPYSFSFSSKSKSLLRWLASTPCVVCVWENTKCLSDASLTTHYLINYYHFIILFSHFGNSTRVTHTHLSCANGWTWLFYCCHRCTSSSSSPWYEHYVPVPLFRCCCCFFSISIAFLFILLKRHAQTSEREPEKKKRPTSKREW